MKADIRGSVLSGQMGVLMMVSVLVAACGKSISPGWRANVATSPPGTVYISLDAPSQPAAVRLTLWPGPKYPGWNRAVLVEMSAQKTILIQSFSDADLSSVMRLVAD